MIEKKIHYVWVGGKPLTTLAKKCIKSWKKKCPDYEIIRWDENNFDMNSNLYCRQAYEHKKWAFVSDYIRLFVLHKYGGVYMDTDVEVIKPLDNFLKLKAFSGFESTTCIPTGIIAAQKGNKWVANMLKYYDKTVFVQPDGYLDLTTNVITITKHTKEMYPELELNGTEQHFEHVSFYPVDYFCPNNLPTREGTKNTYTIHHFAGSWLSRSRFQRMKIFIRESLNFVVGKKNTNTLNRWRKRMRRK